MGEGGFGFVVKLLLFFLLRDEIKVESVELLLVAQSLFDHSAKRLSLDLQVLLVLRLV